MLDLSNPRHSQSGSTMLTAIQQSPHAICLAAVRLSGNSVQYLTAEQQSPAVCLAAVQECGGALKYLTSEQRTPEVCIAAVRQHGVAIRHMTAKQRTPMVCFIVVANHGWFDRPEEVSTCTKWTPEMHPHYSVSTQRLVELALHVSLAVLPLEVAAGVARRIPSIFRILQPPFRRRSLLRP